MDKILIEAEKRAAELRNQLKENPLYKELGEVLSIIKLRKGEPLPEQASTPKGVASVKHKKQNKHPLKPERPRIRVRRARNPNKELKPITPGTKMAYITNAVIDFLRIHQRAATTGEIYAGLVAAGVEIGGNNPRSLLSAYLTMSPKLSYEPGVGYWSPELPPYAENVIPLPETYEGITSHVSI